MKDREELTAVKLTNLIYSLECDNGDRIQLLNQEENCFIYIHREYAWKKYFVIEMRGLWLIFDNVEFRGSYVDLFVEKDGGYDRIGSIDVRDYRLIEAIIEGKDIDEEE